MSPEQPADLQPGDTAVWQATDREGRPVRVKLWGGRLEPQQRELIVAFHLQAKRLASLRSAHAMQVLGHGLDPWRRPYLITECPQGETLAGRLASGRPVAHSPRALVEAVGLFVHQMAAVLSELHALGRVVGVLAAEDVFLVESPTLYVKLLDVGMPDPCCSGVISRATSESALLALEAVAPEMSGRRPLDGRTDIWPVAVLAYRLLTGAHPFKRGSYDETLNAQRTSAFVPPSRHLGPLDPPLAAALDAWFKRALSPSPDGRFGGMMAMSDAWPDAMDRRPSLPELEGDDLGATLFYTRDDAAPEDSGIRCTVDDDDDLPTRLAFIEDEITHSDHDVDADTRPRRRRRARTATVTDEMPLPAPSVDAETSGITAAVRLLAPLDARGSIAPGPVSSPMPSRAELDAIRRQRLVAFEAAQKARRERTQNTVLFTVTTVALVASSLLHWLAG